jgi:hypothetical protein
MKKVILGIFLFLLSFPAFAHRIETIYGYTVNENGITYKVQSNRCTYRQDFSFEVRESYPHQIILYRDKEDNCESMFAHLVDITLTWGELNLPSQQRKDGVDFVIGNPQKQWTERSQEIYEN